MSRKTPSILLVDDEEMVLSSLRGVFALQTEYDVTTASTPKDAIRHVGRAPVDVVISDFLMPEMNGIELLQEVKKLQPDSIRLLLTGYADKENAIKAINEVGLYHYLEKPWDNDALLNIVGNALREKSLSQQLASKVRELDALASEHGELEARHEFLQQELEMAANVQRSVLPTEFPEVSGFRFANLYQPSEAIGGDFFDVVETSGGAAVLVADVVSHGVKAALVTMLLKGVFRESVAAIEDPVELLEEMNRRLYAVLPSSIYAAAAVFFVAPDSPEIPFSNAGVPYPFVLRKEARVDEIVVPGPPLGMFPPKVFFESRIITVEPGDVVFTGSDGIGSIVADDGAMFDDEELRKTLRELTGRDGETVLREMMNRAVNFGGDKPLPDDVNLVTLTRY